MTNGSNKLPLLTIGHSTHLIERFVQLLTGVGATAVADVRSSPYSRFSPHFSRNALRCSLSEAGIAYTFLGKELGARSPDSAYYRNGKVQYDLLAKSDAFAEGIRRVTEGTKRYRIALMCAEKDPIECHRALLVARVFVQRCLPVTHVHADGALEPHSQLEERLLRLWKLSAGDMFKSREEFLAEAYIRQGERVAYRDDQIARQEVVEE